MLKDRREALRGYVQEVVRDLVMRGVLRRQQGQSLVDVMRAEPMVVLREVESDIRVIANEIGVSVGTFVRNNLDSLIGAGARAIAERLTGAAGRKR